MKMMIPTASDPLVTKSANAKITCPALERADWASAARSPAVRTRRTVATFSTSRNSVAERSNEGNTANSSGLVHINRRHQHNDRKRQVERQQHIHDARRQRNQDHQQQTHKRQRENHPAVLVQLDEQRIGRDRGHDSLLIALNGDRAPPDLAG